MKVFSEIPESLPHRDHVGLLDACTSAGVSLEEDVQPDTFAEGSPNFRGAYARRLEPRVFEPADWNQVTQYLEGLGLEHLIPVIDEMGVDSLEDFGFLYREDLMEAGASKEEAEAILGCTRAGTDGRPDGPAQARAGFHRPSRPIAPARPATAARIARAPDRASRIQEGAQGPCTAPSIPGQEGAQGPCTAPSIPGQEGAQGLCAAPSRKALKVFALHQAFQVRKALNVFALRQAFQVRKARKVFALHQAVQVRKVLKVSTMRQAFPVRKALKVSALCKAFQKRKVRRA